jgi:hypothetical protein
MSVIETITGKGIVYGGSGRGYSRGGLATYTAPHPTIGGMLHMAKHGHGGNINYMPHHTAILDGHGGAIGYGTMHNGGRLSVPYRNRHGGGIGSFLGKIIGGIGRFFNSGIPGHLFNIGKSAIRAGTEIAPEIQAMLNRKRPRTEGDTQPNASGMIM